MRKICLKICDKTLVLSSICDKCEIEDEKILKKEQSIETLKIIGLVSNSSAHHVPKCMSCHKALLLCMSKSCKVLYSHTL